MEAMKPMFVLKRTGRAAEFKGVGVPEAAELAGEVAEVDCVLVLLTTTPKDDEVGSGARVAEESETVKVERVADDAEDDKVIPDAVVAEVVAVVAPMLKEDVSERI